MTTFAIIGGGGVFATHLAKYLLETTNARVVSIGRNPVKTSPFSLDVGKRNPRYKYEQIHIVFEQDRLFELLDEEEPEIVVNFAALAYANSWQNASLFYDTNVVALAKMCEGLCQRSYLKRFIQIGTSELYGSVDVPADENAELRPTSPYAVSKLTGDMHLGTMFKTRGFPMNILRPSNAYGPGQALYRVIPRAVISGLTGRKLPLQGDGLAEKSFLHAYDVATAVQVVAEHGVVGEVYNCGPVATTSIRDLVGLVATELGVGFEDLVEFAPARVGEDARYWLDSARIAGIGWKPTIDLTAGIKDMCDWGRIHLDQLVDEYTQFVLRV